MTGHDRQSRTVIARRLAETMGWTFGGIYDGSVAYADTPYFVPEDVLLEQEAIALGIQGPEQLFGGVVPYPFVATKAITHPLVASDAKAPAGWSPAFSENAGGTALHGYTTFARSDASRAASLLLHRGPVRIKCVSGIGGSKQHVVVNARDVVSVLATIGSREFDEAGVTVEEHLADSVTYSVGRVECGGCTISYCGTQQTTCNSRGDEVYGGSTLEVVRGGFDTLLASGLPYERRMAVELAQTYDAAAFTAYPHAFASRRNYDVLLGRDGAGHPRAGVLEQSWRIGGASAAEVMALSAFKRDSACMRVRYGTVEVYDDECPVPPGAFVYYRGIDARVGPLTKYATGLDGHDA